MKITIDTDCLDELIAALGEAGTAIQYAALERDRDERIAWAEKADAEVAFVFNYLYELTPEAARLQQAANYEQADRHFDHDRNN